MVGSIVGARVIAIQIGELEKYPCPHENAF